MPGRDEARKLVEDIFKDHGGISQDVLDRIPNKADRDVILAAMLNKDKLIASSVTTLAKNLYSSNARFVFELLQNCDDNHYSKARKAGTEPAVIFKVHPDRIILECNEDGFQAENLTAICNVGKSSKLGAQGYIGEKGIGFKSVFMAAYKVQVQSGDYSFYFQHRNGDSGMGMITPVWIDYDEDPMVQGTRFTLFLHAGGDISTQIKQRRTIRRQFEDLHETILLFMKNIKDVQVHFYNHAGNQDHCTRYIMKRETDVTVSVHRIKDTYTGQAGSYDRDSQVKHYHMTRYTATNLAANENRTYSDLEKQTKAYSEGNVVLAFPLTQNAVPILENQWIFAFLPVRQMGFKFLIHADFVTEASRQAIVTTSARNEGLIQAIAEAFMKAILQFNEHSTLQYQWMRFLPQDDSYPWDGFWKRLIERIGELLRETAILQAAKPGPLRRLAECRQLSADALDKNGLPLLPDIQPGFYLSSRYVGGDLDLLRKHGLGLMDIEDLITRAEHDLRSAQSRIRSTKDEDWQRRLSDLLNLPFRKSWPKSQEGVKSLALVPLRNGTWVSINKGPVYYPRVAQTQLNIAGDLPLAVVDPEAIKNTARKSLFDSIGVQAASVALIRTAIIKKHIQPWPKGLDCSDAVYHATFLYLTEHLCKPPYLYFHLWIRPEGHNFSSKPSMTDIYLRSQAPYGAAELLRRIEAGAHSEHAAPGLDVQFLHPMYLETQPAQPTADSLPWKEWLHHSLGIQSRPRLMSGDKAELSDICRYVAKHRPDKFLGYLQANWEFNDPPTTQESERIKELGEIAVLCKGGVMHPLESTYLPTDELKQLSSRFLLDLEFFPQLQVETKHAWDTFPVEWIPLGRALGLGFKKPELNILLDILRHLLDANQSAKRLENPKRVCELYGHIQAEIQKSNKSQESKQLVRSFFRENPAIFVPKGDLQDAAWALPQECAWDAPIELLSTHSLSRLYERNFKGYRAELGRYFAEMLEIPRFGWTQVLEEIRYIKSGGSGAERLGKIYGCAANPVLFGISREAMKKTFQSEALIRSPHQTAQSWYTPDQCLWSSGTKIRGKLTLQDLYPDLEDFFVAQLGVKSMTAKMVYDELCCKQDSVDDAKQKIETFSTLLTVENCGRDFSAPVVFENAIFPVKLPNGAVELKSGKDVFFISDRQSLCDAYAGKAKLLDFSLDELHTMMPFFKWVGIEDRCLSHKVEEVSSVEPSSTRTISWTRRDIRRRAHALLSIAVSHHSPRARGNKTTFYNLLRKLQTLETDSFISEMRLEQDGKTLVAKKEAPMLHIAEDDMTLRIYVPQNRVEQKFCFNLELPKRLSEWLMTEPGEKLRDPVPDKLVQAVQAVLNVEGRASLAAALEFSGIVPVNDPPPHEKELEEQDEDIQRQEFEPCEEEIAGGKTPASSISPLSARGSSATELVWHEVALSNFSDANSRLGVQAAHSVIPIRSSGSNDYAKLLCIVVRTARRFAFPSKGAFDMSAAQMALSKISRHGNGGGEEPYKLRASSQEERDVQVGAAGELFAFEVLSHLDPSLPDFSRANWQSTIRSFVRQHPDYLDLKPWEGSETADIMYTDSSGKLTDLLIDKGYLASDTWAGARPHYDIEVKTTTGPCDMPFYMSKYQYERMQKYSNGPSSSRTTERLYVMFRVYNLGKDSVGMRVLVHPESMRQSGELGFTAEAWSVVSAS